ncbi:hypothetical protein [Dyadobacter diqingensis]|uniref:hypothetical protein n=1 Tax=Dyadobacter diqingensis TaxID=2938121 RepID=UPI0020C2B996|nr:hypothetical protein [Dyadobacter diqingensis]
MKKVFIQELDAHCQLVDSYTDLRKRGDVVAIVKAAYLNPLSIPVKLELLRKLFQAPPEVWYQLEQPENHDELWRLMSHLEWVWKGPEVKPLHFIRLRGKTFLLPDEDLFFLSTSEFVVATAHLIGFWTSKTDAQGAESLARFMATITRPKKDVMQRLKSKDDPDQREVFSSVRTESRWKIFAKTDIVTQILVAQWFNNAGNRLLKRYGMTGGSGDDAMINQGVFVQDWERQIVKVAESQVYGNYDAVMSRSLPEVLSYIDLKNEEIRRQNQANRRN